MSIADFTAARDVIMDVQQSDPTGTEVCEAIANGMMRIARYDAAAVMTTDPETHLPAGGVVYGFEAKACVPFWDNELLDPDFNKFNDLARSIDPVATLAEATDGDLGRSPRFTKMYEPSHASDELRVAFTSGTTCLAIGAFLRCDGQTYTPSEVNDVRNLLVPASNALRRALGRHRGESIAAGPIVVLLGPDGKILSVTEGAEDVLEDLRVDSVDDEIPGTILVAASKARASRASTKLTTRLRGRSGRWVRIHVCPMSGGVESVSVTIESAHAGDLVPILLDSYGLTTRETDIVLALCRGFSTKEIAAECGISVHTVRDHMKAIFAKSRVTSRGELVANLFSKHVLGTFHEAVVDANEHQLHR
ncbi:MAG: helix-turn-helix transcriptional regulator [Ornithinimicrobium sp.]